MIHKELIYYLIYNETLDTYISKTNKRTKNIQSAKLYSIKEKAEQRAESEVGTTKVLYVSGLVLGEANALIVD